jgi:hypothetical protein
MRETGDSKRLKEMELNLQEPEIISSIMTKNPSAWIRGLSN